MYNKDEIRDEIKKERNNPEEKGDETIARIIQKSGRHIRA